MNSAFRLMELIGQVDDAYIEQSCAEVKSRRSGILWKYAVAAALVLVLAGAGSMLLHRGDNLLGSQAASGSGADSAPAEAAAEEAAPAEREVLQAGPEAGKGEEAEEIGMEAAETAPEDAAGAVITDEEDKTEYLEGMTLGQIAVGMPEDQVLAILGEPPEKSTSGPVTDEDGVIRISWFYDRLHVQLADAGDGWSVTRVTALEGGTAALSNGIGIGSPEADVTGLGWPFAAECGVLKESDGTGERESVITTYTLVSGGQILTISVQDGAVIRIELADYDSESDARMTEQDAPAYHMSGDPITVYIRGNSGWEAAELSGKDAKMLETILNIEDLQARDESGTPQYVIDFHGDTVAVLYGPDEGGAVYTLPDGISFTREMLEDGTFDEMTLYCYCLFPAGVWDTVSDLTGQ